MDTRTAFFYLFSIILLFAAFRVVTARNTVHAALFLVLAFFQTAGIWLLLKAEFLAISLVLVYVGAVMVLFLFVVMMLNIDAEQLRGGLGRHFPLAAFIGMVVALEMVYLIMGGWTNRREPLPTPTATGGVVSAAAQVPNTQELGTLLYTEYVYPLQIAAVILLVAMIAAIALTLRGRKVKAQEVGAQVRVKAHTRLRIIKMQANEHD